MSGCTDSTLMHATAGGICLRRGHRILCLPSCTGIYPELSIRPFTSSTGAQRTASRITDKAMSAKPWTSALLTVAELFESR